MEKDKALPNEVFQDDGGLYDLGWYLSWTPCEDSAVLDGRFTAEALRAIADHMEKVNGTRTRT